MAPFILKQARARLSERPPLQTGVLAVIAARIFIFIVFCFPFASMARAEFFSIDNISVALPACMQVPQVELQYACHRFGAGSGFGVAFRKYFAPRGIDDGAFEKLTIYFKTGPKAGQINSFPSPDVFAYFSSGPSSFPGKHGCFGTARKGTVKVVSISNQSVQLNIDIDFDLKSPLGWVSECKKASIDMVMKATEISRDKLDAWYGKQVSSPSIWDESKP
jgi:hypothetical protein